MNQELDIAPPQPGSTVTMYSPFSIINIFNNSISVKEEKAIIIVKGVFIPGRGKNYSGFFYDSLREENGSFVLQLKISGRDRSKLKPGSLVELKSFITRKVDEEKGVINIFINVVEVLNQAAVGFSEADMAAFKLMQEKAAKGFRDVESFLMNCVTENKRPVIKIVIGQNAIVDSDIKHGFAESISYFNPEFLKVNLSQEESIIKVLEQTKAHVLVIARGGGTGLEVFNSVGLARAALNCKPYLISAVGHKEDVTLIDKMCDKSFITPTDLGNFFKEVYNRAAEQLSNSKGKLIDEVSKQVEKKYAEKFHLQEKLLLEREEQINSLKVLHSNQITPGKVLLYVAIAVVVGFILAMVVRG